MLTIYCNPIAPFFSAWLFRAAFCSAFVCLKEESVAPQAQEELDAWDACLAESRSELAVGACACSPGPA